MATDCAGFSADSRTKQAIRRRLVAWYAKNARDLPWRNSRDAYRIWLSEVMLQQTTVAMILPRYEQFVAAFPTVHALAAADEQEVLRQWEGLGYYRRARGLHAAARQIVADYAGELPRDVATLMRLPGIGRYTAGAVASFAYDVPAPILECNTQRVLARITGFAKSVATTEGQHFLWSAAEALVPRRGAGRFNLALMELGAILCTPFKPKCSDCPLTSHCTAFRKGLQDSIPRLAARPKPTAVREAAVVVRKNGRVLLRRRVKGERWENMWDFPRFSLTTKNGPELAVELIANVKAQTQIVCKPGSLLTTIRHGVTRFRITLECYEARYQSGRLRTAAAGDARWVPPSALSEFPLSASARRLARLL